MDEHVASESKSSKLTADVTFTIHVLQLRLIPTLLFGNDPYLGPDSSGTTEQRDRCGAFAPPNITRHIARVFGKDE